ncbi:MAG: hypothetical protein ACK5MD_05835 [Flavobacteriales bacterium]
MLQKRIQIILVLLLISCGGTRYIKERWDTLYRKNYKNEKLKIPMEEVNKIQKREDVKEVAFDVKNQKKELSKALRIAKLEDLLFHLEFVNYFRPYGTDTYEEHVKKVQEEQDIYFVERFELPGGLTGVKFIVVDQNSPFLVENIYLLIIQGGYIKSISRVSDYGWGYWFSELDITEKELRYQRRKGKPVETTPKKAKRKSIRKRIRRSRQIKRVRSGKKVRGIVIKGPFYPEIYYRDYTLDEHGFLIVKP